jgi:hypothetical protein
MKRLFLIMFKHHLGVSLLLFLLIFLFRVLSPTMPLALFLIFNLAAAVPLFLVSAHVAAIRRTRLLSTYDESGKVRKFLSYVFFRNILLFVLSLIISFFFLINVALINGIDWLWLGLAIPVFFAAGALIPKIMVKESIAWLRAARAKYWTVVVATVIFVAARFTVFIFLGEGAASGAHETPFAQSSSSFLKIAGAWAIMFGSWGNMSMNIVHDFSNLLWAFFMAFNNFCLYGGILSILSCLTLRPGEWRRGFLPPTDQENPQKLQAATTAAYSACLAAFFVMVLMPSAAWLESISVGEKGAALERARARIEETGKGVILALDGHYYRPEAEAALKKFTMAAWGEVMADNEEVLKEGNRVFDLYRDNVDSYLDWYYSLTGEYARLKNLIFKGASGAEKYMAEKLIELLGNGVDPRKLMADVARLQRKLAEFREKVGSVLSQYEVPANMLGKATIKQMSLESIIQKANHVEFSFKKRLAISGSIGLTGGIAAGIAAKVGQKAIFKAGAAALAKIVGSKALAPAGAAAGAAVGSVVPGLGNAVGFAAGLALGFGVEKLMLIIADKVNRDEFKAAILNAIEEQRKEFNEALKVQDAHAAAKP